MADQDVKLMEMSDRWARVIDNVRYLEVEHRHKEKEYGIKWRTAYKIELEKELDKLVAKFGNPLEGKIVNDKFEIMLAIVEKDFKDIK